MQISSLREHVAYKIIGLQEKHHPHFGLGVKAIILQSDGRPLWAMLPQRIVKELSSDGINALKADMSKDMHPYLIFRGINIDHSYRIDLLPKSKHLSLSCQQKSRSNHLSFPTFAGPSNDLRFDRGAAFPIDEEMLFSIHSVNNITREMEEMQLLPDLSEVLESDGDDEVSMACKHQYNETHIAPLNSTSFPD